MSLSPSMRMFGTAINDEFGDVEESGIFFAVSEIFEEKKGRHRHISCRRHGVVKMPLWGVVRKNK